MRSSYTSYMMVLELRGGPGQYIKIGNYFCREKIADKIVTFEYTLTNKQITDELIKALTRDKFEVFREAIDLRL